MRITITRSELNRMTKHQMFEWYKEHVNDEVSPIYWNGFTRQEWIDTLEHLVIESPSAQIS